MYSVIKCTVLVLSFSSQATIKLCTVLHVHSSSAHPFPGLQITEGFCGKRV